MPFVIVGHGLTASGLDWQTRLAAVEGLDLALFVDREHDGMGRRIDIEADDVDELGSKAGIARVLEGTQPMRLQFVRPPDALYRAQRDANGFGHRPAGPMGRLVRRFGAGQRHHPRDDFRASGSALRPATGRSDLDRQCRCPLASVRRSDVHHFRELREGFSH